MFSNLFRLLNIQAHIQCTGKLLYILKLPILGIAQMGIAQIFRDFETYSIPSPEWLMDSNICKLCWFAMDPKNYEQLIYIRALLLGAYFEIKRQLSLILRPIPLHLERFLPFYP